MDSESLRREAQAMAERADADEIYWMLVELEYAHEGRKVEFDLVEYRGRMN